jgi:zinc protease
MSGHLPAAALRSLPNAGNVTRVQLANGLTILVRENHSSPIVTLHGSLQAGAVDETAAQAGLATLTAAMLSRGSERYSFDQFNDAVEAVGGNLTLNGDAHSTDFNLACLAEDFPQLLDVLADALLRPLFPADHLEKVRQERLVRLQERDQDTSAVANLRFYETIYDGHPYGRSVAGYAPTVTSLTRQDLVDFHRRFYAPAGAVIVVAGDVATATVIAQLTGHFGAWQATRPERFLPPQPPLPATRQLHIPMKGKFQADIVLGGHALSRFDPDFYVARVANCILGQFGMMGRLGETVREQQGLAYYCYSALDAEPTMGLWLAAAGVNPTHVDQAVTSIYTEFARIGGEGVTAQELDDAQSYLTGVVPLTLETNDGVAATLLNMEWYGLGLDFLDNYPALIRAVTVADVQRVAARFLRPEACVTVVAGPAER